MTLRRLAVLLLIAAGLIGLIAPAATAATSTAGQGSVIVAAAPGLTWTDVRSMPRLRAILGHSGIGLLADKTQLANPVGCAAGLVQVDAGTRVSVEGSNCNLDETPALSQINARNDYNADIYALGDELHQKGIWTAATGPGAAALIARQGGVVDAVERSVRSALDSVTRHGRAVIAAVDSALLSHPGLQGRAAVDRWIGDIEADLPPSCSLLIAGTSDLTTPALHVIALHEPSGTSGSLTSVTTGRARFVESVDIAPTVLTQLGLPVPNSMIGHAITIDPADHPDVADLVDANRHAVAAGPAAIAARILIMVIAGLAVSSLLLGWRRPAVTLARVAAPLPLATWLLQLVPWWHRGAAWLAAAMLILGMANAWWFSRRPSKSLELLGIPAVTAVVLLADQLTGGGLQISAPLGDNPLEAGRYTGVGNTDFAVLLASGLFVIALVAARLNPSLRLVLAGIGCVVLVGVDGAPSIGDDLGGLLAAVPAALVVLALLAGARLSVSRLVAIAAVAVAAAFGAAALDYSRPAAEQTHLGHFFGQLLHGGAGHTVRRKLIDVLKLQGELPLVIALLYRVFPARLRGGIADWLRECNLPGLPAAVAGVIVIAILGSIFNDSGLSIAALAVAAVAPSLIAATTNVRADATVGSAATAPAE